jgi:Carboxypeptidase regulatory-like domain
MVRRLGFFVVILGLALPAWSADRSGTIAGYVHNAAGAPQMGALVEILGSGEPISAFTDEHGFFSAGGLLPGVYDIQVSAASFLPSFHDGVGISAGSRVLLNLTLNTLFDGLKISPAKSPADQDDWKWVLRSSANRPILRMLPGQSATQSAALNADSDNNSHELKGSLSFLAGAASDGFGGGSDMTTAFSVERSIFSSDTIGLWGNIGYSDGAAPASVVRASFRHKMDNGSQPEFALTMRNLPAPFTMPNATLQALSMRTSDDLVLGSVVELHFGSELQTIQFLGRVTAFQPFGSADIHLSPSTVVEYRYATSEPDNQMEKGFESAPPDLSESQPRMTMVNYNSALEHAHHHELSVSHRMGKTNVQAAAYYDRVVDPALTGVGEFSTFGGMVLPDIYSGTFSYQGSDLKTGGMRLVLQQKLTADITGTMDLEYGGVLALENPDPTLATAQDWMDTRYRHSMAGKLSGVMPKARTKWIASYRWIDGPALTPVDMFNASPGQASPYLNIYLRQPVPLLFPGHLEAVVDLRNLLAQGYVPVLGHDGRTVYLVQSARAVRGGLNFTF